MIYDDLCLMIYVMIWFSPVFSVFFYHNKTHLLKLSVQLLGKEHIGQLGLTICTSDFLAFRCLENNFDMLPQGTDFTFGSTISTVKNIRENTTIKEFQSRIRPKNPSEHSSINRPCSP